MLKRSVVLGLCIGASQINAAPIYVTTTEDTVADDKQCSLREAIEYINLGMPKEGHNGCGGEGAENTIYLKAKTEYKLKSQVKIQNNLILRTESEQGADETRPEIYNATIKMTGKDRLFWIERHSESVNSEDPKPGPILASFFRLTLKGCNDDQCQDQGGLIYNKENIEVTRSQLQGGKARLGGAIYNAGEYKEGQSLSTVKMFNALFKDNKAVQGAVIYSELPQYIGTGLVLRDNEVTDANAALMEIKTPFTEEQLKKLGNTLLRGVSNSTVFNNKGFVIRVVDGMSLNNNTIILNNKGLIVDSPLKQAYVANSILLNNGQQDCQVKGTVEANNMTNNLYSAGCEGKQGQVLPKGTVLLAGKSIDAECDIDSEGILCPFNNKSKDSDWGFFKPRLLNRYKFITDSPIVNRGPILGEQEILSCAAMDQREKPRPINQPEHCDRGAIELYVDTLNTERVGKDIFYGQVATMTLDEQLKDGELVRPEVCVGLFGQRPDGQNWQPGCLKTVQSNSTLTSKGSLSISQAGVLTYVPNGNWHGLDEFTTLVVTTTTRFTDSTNPYVSIPTRIVQGPQDGIDNKKVGGGGSTGLWGLLGLVAVAVLRHASRKRGAKHDSI